MRGLDVLAAAMIPAYVTTELVLGQPSNDGRAFAWVTLHFVVFPLIAIFLLATAAVDAFRTDEQRRWHSMLLRLSVAACVLYLTYRADMPLSRLLHR